MQDIQKFISIFMSAVANCSLYSKDHSSVDELNQKAFSILNEILNESESLSMMIIEDDLIVNKQPLREAGLHGNNLIRRFRKKGISRVDFLRGITAPELKQFIVDIVSAEGVKTYPFIKTGVIDVKVGDLKTDINIDIDNLSSFTSAQVEMVKELYYSVSPFKRLNVAGLEEIVVNFILTFRREASILKLISPVRTYSEYTYTHATNVAVLTMFQAETLGVSDALLRDIGIAALLHDVGKLFISNEILEKKGPLDQKEWEEVRSHPLCGAKYLAKMDGVPRLSAIVAMEHHLRFDGKGYPEQKLNGKKQHFCSQTVAIADYFDALRSRRPYRRELNIEEVLTLMKKESPGTFNEHLLNNFIRSILRALAE